MEELRIVVIDDEKRAVDRIVRALGRVGFPVHAVLLCPEEGRLTEPLLGLSELTTTSLAEYDLAMVDLELEALHRRQRESIRYHPDDLRGGSEILPHIRREAPWLPVVGYSKLFDFEIESFLAVVGSFGFDGMVQRAMFDDSWLTHELWDLVLRQVQEARRRAVLGPGYLNADKKTVDVRYPDALASEFTALGSGWEELFQLMFHFSTVVSLQPLSSGFSGATVIRATVTSQLDVGSQTGSWVVKVSTSRGKLWEECRAHSHLAKAGLPMARSVPLLWEGLVISRNLAGIAYQLASEADDALRVLRRDGSEAALVRIRPILQEFHESANRDHYPLGKLLLRAVSSTDRVLTAIAAIPTWKFGQEWRRSIDGFPAPMLDRTVFVTAGLIHGDLHLRNILFGQRDVLIDFAETKAGPIVYDVARLLTDVLLAESTTLDRVSTADHGDPIVASLLMTLTGGSWKTQQDRMVFDASFQLCLAQAVTYESLDPATQSRLTSILVRSPPPSGD